MDRIKINLSTKKYTGKGLGIFLPVALTVLSLFLFFYMSVMSREKAEDIGRMENRLAELSKRVQPKKPMLPESTASLPAIRNMVEQRSFSWIEALDNVERAIPAGVSLSSVRPSFKENGASLSGYARDFSALSRFIDNLEGLKVYKRVFLTSQHADEVDEKDAISFNISIEGGR